MKSKDIRREGRGVKERRAKPDIVSDSGFDSDFPAKDAKYRIVYGRSRKATVTYLDGPNKNKTATYNGQTNEWSGVKVPPGIKHSVERYYS